MPATGALLCLASAVAFGTMAIFGKLALAEGATLGTALAVRFAIAAALLWLLVLAGGHARRLRLLGRRDVALALALGALCYTAQSGAFFASLTRLDASPATVLLHAYPAFVTVAAVALARERASARTGVVLALTAVGLVLVTGGGLDSLDPLGVLLALAAAAIYGVYILVSEPLAVRVPAVTLCALVCTGAAVALTLCAGAAGDLRPGAVEPAGFAWLGALAVVSTVAAIALLFAGLRRVGPTAASILSTLEPVVTIALAAAAFGESLTPAQLTGGALVLCAVLAVRVPARLDTGAQSRLEQEPA